MVLLWGAQKEHFCWSERLEELGADLVDPRGLERIDGFSESNIRDILQIELGIKRKVLLHRAKVHLNHLLCLILWLLRSFDGAFLAMSMSLLLESGRVERILLEVGRGDLILELLTFATQLLCELALPLLPSGGLLGGVALVHG